MSTNVEEIKKLTADFQSRLEESDAKHKGTEELTASTKEALAKMEVDFSKFENANQELTAKLAAKEKEEKELKDRFSAMEAKLLRLPSTSVIEKSETLCAFEKFAKTGEFDRKYLRTDNDPQGGYLAPDEYVNEIIKKITETSRIRTIARIRRTSFGQIEIPTRTSLIDSNWVGEAIPATESQSLYGKESIKVNKLSVYARATFEMLRDASFNMDTEINADFIEEITRAEGAAFVNGTGGNMPEGFMQNAAVASINSGVANAITADSLLDVYAELKTGYNGTYLLNRKSLNSVRKLKDGTGQYLWVPGIALGMPNTINGRPYIETPDMPDEGANTYPVIYGDFLRSYTIVDGMDMGLIRDNLTLATQAMIKYVLMKSTGGKVTLPEGLKKIKCSV